MTILTVLHIVTCVILVLVVLIQSGKGADISASLGGSSQTVFGSSGGANFFTRFTSIAAAIFMTTSLTLTVLTGTQSRKSVMDGVAVPQAAAPAAPADTAAQPTDAGKPADAAKTDAKPADAAAQKPAQ
ncbi:MAG: preprotein translocase subunit SecG [Bdellovibrionales bacterium]|nr:preprotein translocase subunit SecG [Bdellovibrionales bacterium]